MCSIVKNYHYHIFNGEESSLSLLSMGKNCQCPYHRDQSVSPISVQAFAQCHSGSSQTEKDEKEHFRKYIVFQKKRNTFKLVSMREKSKITGPMTSCSQRTSGRNGTAWMVVEMFLKTGVFATQMSMPSGNFDGGG